MNDGSSESYLLELTDVHSVYGRMSLALSGVTLQVPANSIVALLGANGAGKTTTLKSISNLIALDGGRVTSGRIVYKGVEIQRRDPEHLVAQGIVQVLEGRRCFSHLTVEENLLVSCKKMRHSSAEGRRGIDEIYTFFPKLKERRRTQAGYISGGEQQMLAIGRAILAEPQLLLLDEPSMGVAPIVVAEIYEILSALSRQRGFSILLAEQSTHLALRCSDYGYTIGNGRVVQEGSSENLRLDPMIQEHYLGKHEESHAVGGGGSDRRNTWMI